MRSADIHQIVGRIFLVALVHSTDRIILLSFVGLLLAGAPPRALQVGQVEAGEPAGDHPRIAVLAGKHRQHGAGLLARAAQRARRSWRREAQYNRLSHTSSAGRGSPTSGSR